MSALEPASPNVRFTVPASHTVVDLKMSDGAIIRVRRHGNPEGVRLVLSHGNGFAIDAYYPFWRQFLTGHDVILYDQRNHGWNPTHHRSGHTIARMAEDMEAVLSAVTAGFGARSTIGIFHSLSTLAGLVHYMQNGPRWDALVLVDLPLTPPPGHRLHELARDFEIVLRDWALQRTKHFSSPHELAVYFKRTRRARRWVAGAADLMAQAITRPAAEGGYELVCPPAFESQIFGESSGPITWSVKGFSAPNLFVVSSDYLAPDADPQGKVCEAMAVEFGIPVVRIPETGHLLQIERPEFVAQVVREYLYSLNLDRSKS